jgi:hypothetical protein
MTANIILAVMVNTRVRTTNLRCALNDLRALHSQAVTAGTADDRGAHLPKMVELGDGSVLWIRNRDASKLEDPGVRVQDGRMLGFFEGRRIGADGKQIGTVVYIP